MFPFKVSRCRQLPGRSVQIRDGRCCRVVRIIERIVAKQREACGGARAYARDFAGPRTHAVAVAIPVGHHEPPHCRVRVIAVRIACGDRGRGISRRKGRPGAHLARGIYPVAVGVAVHRLIREELPLCRIRRCAVPGIRDRVVISVLDQWRSWLTICFVTADDSETQRHRTEKNRASQCVAALTPLCA
jgi:hypothetical protein